MNITVIGCGRWGSFVAWYLGLIGHEVTLYGRENSANMRKIIQERSNGVIQFSKGVKFETNLKNSLEADTIIISINSQGLRSLLEEIKVYSPRKKCFVLCMKGIEITTRKRLTEVVDEFFGEECEVAVWLGPGHVEDFCQGIPNCMVIDSVNEKVKERLIEEFSGKLIRFYVGTDLIGNELGAAAKNVIGIGAGMLDGLGLSSLKGALMARGTREIARLIVALGGDEYSAYGLCHLGDYEATVFSMHSHNRQFGENIIRGQEYTKLAEGYYTAKALYDIAIEHNIDLPICTAIYRILYEKEKPQEVLSQLFLRLTKKEFDR